MNTNLIPQPLQMPFRRFPPVQFPVYYCHFVDSEQNCQIFLPKSPLQPEFADFFTKSAFRIPGNPESYAYNLFVDSRVTVARVATTQIPARNAAALPPQIMKYINKISGPLLDRIDIHIEVPPVNPSFRGQSNGETSDKIRERVNKARDIQTVRFENDDIHCNAHMENRHIKKYCNPLLEAEKLLDLAMRELNLSPPTTGF